MERRFIVGFFIQNPFHYFLYESVINSLVSKNVSCHLIINDQIKNDLEWENMYNGLIDFIEEIDRNDIEAFLFSTVLSSGFPYDCLISPYYHSGIEKIGKKNIRLMYSLAKESWTYSWWNVIYDKILCYGNYDFKKLNLYNNCEIIGNPKFDKWFRDELPNYSEIKKEYNLSLDENKKTILYAPTYGELSSIDQWIDQFKDVSNKFNIIIKLHHGTTYLQSEKNRRVFIKGNFRNILNDTADLLKILKISDYVVSDNSGVIYDAILAEKNIILLNTNFNQSLNEMTIESKIRRHIVNLDIGTSLLEILQSKELLDSQKKILLEIKNALYLKSDGFAGERAANEVVELLSKQDDKSNHFLLSLREKLFS